MALMTCRAAGEKAEREDEGLGGLILCRENREPPPLLHSSSRAACAGRGARGRGARGSGKAAASPFDQQQREQEETAPGSDGAEGSRRLISALMLRVPQFLPAESCHSLSRRIASEYSSPTTKDSFPARKPSEHFQRPCSLLKSNYQPTGFSSPFPSSHPLTRQPVSSPKPSAAEAPGRSR